MGRAKWKGTLETTIWKKEQGKKNRNETILPKEVGKELFIHSGKEYKSIIIKPSNVGMKAGQLVPTTIGAVYKRKKFTK